MSRRARTAFVGLAAALATTAACRAYDDGETRTPDAGTDAAVAPDAFSPPVDAADGAASDADAYADAAEQPCDPRGKFIALEELTALTTAEDEGRPTLTADELDIYFHRGSTSASRHVFHAHRASRATPFDVPTTPTQLAYAINFPFITADGNQLFYAALNGAEFDLYVAKKLPGTTLFDTPTLLGPPVSSSVSDRSPALSADGKWLYLSTQRGLAPSPPSPDAMYVAPAFGGGFGPPVQLTDGLGGVRGFNPALSASGETIYFSTPTGASALVQIVVASVAPDGRTLTKIEPIATPSGATFFTGGNELVGSVSPDDCRLYFSGGPGGNSNLYVATRR